MTSQIAVDTAKVVTLALSLDHGDTMVRPRPEPEKHQDEGEGSRQRRRRQ